jgi:hypothetical protein
VAVVVHRGSQQTAEQRLTKILDFFGVPWNSLDLRAGDGTDGVPPDHRPYALLGSLETIAECLADDRSGSLLQRASSVYAYAGDDPDTTIGALAKIAGGTWTWAAMDGKSGDAEISPECPEFTGPMSGVCAILNLAAGDGVFVTTSDAARAQPIITIDRKLAFCKVQLAHGSAYVSASSDVPDIDATVARNYYDVKTHFLAAVPLVMFITATFRDVMWRPNELGACLIIDDPLLKPRYGFCDFRWLRDRMREQGFTTSIAFIPWNWRRTSKTGSDFFRNASDVFSVSIHGCDHVAAEFGTPSGEQLERRAHGAQARMRRHQARTRLDHDPVMVFPQGVFSAECPAVLKRNGFIAAVNTEVSPVGDSSEKTRIRDVWDIAIQRYGSFAVYTRRYERHGIENFAFDLLLGKPCFIVAHHDEFRNGAPALLTLIDRLQRLNCTLHWRSAGDVVRRAYRVRGNGAIRTTMYATELLLENFCATTRAFDVEKVDDPASVAAVFRDEAEIPHVSEGSVLRFRVELAPGGRVLVRTRYAGASAAQQTRRSAKYEVSVAARRFLSELRDEYLQPLVSSAR